MVTPKPFYSRKRALFGVIHSDTKLHKISSQSEIVMASSSWKSNSKKARLICHFGALLAVTMWGASFVSTKILTNHNLGPVEIYIYRFVMAYTLVLISCHKKIFANSWRDELLFAVCGLCGGSIYFIAENTAVTYTRVSDVSMITTLSPLLTTLLIGALYKAERPGKWTYISSLIAFIGVACIVFKDGFSPAKATDAPDSLSVTIGDLLALAAACSWAIYSVVLRKLNVTYSALFVTRKTFFYGLVTAIPFWLLSSEPTSPISELTQPDVLCNLLFLGLLCSMGAYMLWSWVMNVLGAITTNNYLYIQPIITMIIAAILFSDDPLTLIGCFGAFLIIGGLWFGDYMSRRDSLK